MQRRPTRHHCARQIGALQRNAPSGSPMTADTANGHPRHGWPADENMAIGPDADWLTDEGVNCLSSIFC